MQQQQETDHHPPVTSSHHTSCAGEGGSDQHGAEPCVLQLACPPSALSGRLGASNTRACPMAACPSEPAWGPLNERFQCFIGFDRAQRGNGPALGRRSHHHRHAYHDLLCIGQGRRSCAAVSARRIQGALDNKARRRCVARRSVR
jgi:hypothetical protein